MFPYKETSFINIIVIILKLSYLYANSGNVLEFCSVLINVEKTSFTGIQHLHYLTTNFVYMLSST